MEVEAGPESSIPLRDVEGDKYFWVHNGPVVKNLHELYGAIIEMSDETFMHHVNEEKSDFYNWIKDVLHDKKLANRLSNLKTRQEIAEAIKERIEELSSKPKIKEAIVKKAPKATKTIRKKISIKPRILAKKEHAKTETRDLSGIEKRIREKPYSIGGTIVAVAILFAVVAILKLSEATITGAATTELKDEGIAILGTSMVIGLCVLVIFTLEKTKKDKQ